MACLKFCHRSRGFIFYSRAHVLLIWKRKVYHYSLFPKLSLHYDFISLHCLFIVRVNAWKATFCFKICRETGIMAELKSRRHGKKRRSVLAWPILFVARINKSKFRVFLSSVENECTRLSTNAKSLFHLRANQQGYSYSRVINPVLYSLTICCYKQQWLKFYQDFSVFFWVREHALFQVSKYTKSFKKKSLKFSFVVCLFSFLSRWLLCTRNKLRSHLFSLYGSRINVVNQSWHITWLRTRLS